MKIPEQVIEEIKDKISIVDVVGDYVSLQMKGDRYWGRCPFHQEKTPSFTVTPDKGLFYCFGCQKGGTVFSFIQDIENCSFVESVEILAKKAGVDISYDDSGESTERKKLIDLHNRVAQSFHYIFMNKPEAEAARRYLRNRGITGEVLEHFKIGWAPRDNRWLKNFLLSKKYSWEFLMKSGLFSKKRGYPLFTGRIIFPICGLREDVIGFGGRTLDENSGPKYINSPESAIFKKGLNLYGINRAIGSIKKEKQFLLVEGYTDVMALHMAGITYAVAPLGTAFTENQARMMKRYAEGALIMFDGDEAGQNAVKKSIRVLERVEIDSRVIKPEKNADPADILKENGVQTLKKILDYSINSIEYIMEKVFEKYPTGSPAEKADACWEVFSYIDEVESEIKKEEYLKQLAEKAHLEITTIRQDYKRWGQGTSKNTRTGQDGRLQPANEPSRKSMVPIDLYLMFALVSNVDYFSVVRNELDPKEFEDSAAKELFVLMEENYRQGTLNTQSLIEQIKQERFQQYITEIAASGEFADNEERIIQDSIRKIKEQNLNKKKKRLYEKIRTAERVRQEQSIVELQEELIYIDEELKKLRVNRDVGSPN